MSNTHNTHNANNDALSIMELPAILTLLFKRVQRPLLAEAHGSDWTFCALPATQTGTRPRRHL